MVESVLVLDRRRAREYVRVDSRLVEIVDDALRVWPVLRCYAGSIWRSEAENSGAGAKSLIHVVEPHTGLRAVDLGGRNTGPTLDKQWGACARVASAINRKWVYDPRRPDMVVAYAARHGTGPHVHCQVHPRTRKRRRA